MVMIVIEYGSVATYCTVVLLYSALSSQVSSIKYQVKEVRYTGKVLELLETNQT
jgi:hypothetical protein